VKRSHGRVTFQRVVDKESGSDASVSYKSGAEHMNSDDTTWLQMTPYRNNYCFIE
jgi:hypothetical protein